MRIKTAIIAGILIIGLSAGYFLGTNRKSEQISHKTETGQKTQPAAAEDAIKIFKERIAANPNDAEAVARLADIYFENGRFEDAISEYKKAVKINADEAKDNFIRLFLRYDWPALREHDLSVLRVLQENRIPALPVLQDADPYAPSRLCSEVVQAA